MSRKGLRSSWPGRLHRLLDRATRRLEPALRRSEPLRRAWTGLLDRVVALQSDRRYLTGRILPALAAHRLRKVLFVGVRGYTRGYEPLFAPSGAEFWTTDVDPAVARYGAPGRHATGDIQEADRLFPGARFDLVVLNGIFGWGVDEPESMERTIRAVHAILAEDGILLIGWNHDRSPDPDDLPAAKALFKPASIGGLPPRHGFDDVTHVYSWYRRTA